MKPEIRNFYHLLGYEFHIPSFQRGYRWEEKQVIDLLNDLKDFYNDAKGNGCNNDTSTFYCLQPIVVKRRTDRENSFDLIDGQQRLTTLFLILSYLQNTREDYCNNQKMYSLKFDTRIKDGDYLNNMEFKTDDGGYEKNIDFFFIHQAYQTIKSWFNNNNKQYKLPIVQLLVDESSAKDSEKRDVRVIWYEADDIIEHDKKQSSIDIFTRLNYGKIGLTETELVKALILQCDIYGERKDIMRQWAYKVAADWDKIEQDLQNRLFWSMLTPKSAHVPSHISFVLDFVARYNLYETKMNKSGEIDPKKENFIYATVNAFLSTSFESRVAELWEYVQDTFVILKDWYTNRNLYHLIGLLTLWNVEKDLLFKLFKQYLAVDRNVFPQKLKEKIGEQVKLKGNMEIENLRYNRNPTEMIHILELFNVQMMNELQQDDGRFNFYKFREQNVTSLEHIHPQNLDVENINFNDLLEWLNRKEESLGYLKRSKEVDLAIKAVNDLRQYLLPDNEKLYEANKELCLTLISTIDCCFNELAGIDNDVMHSLGNMTLIDKDTNAALSNRLLSEKRNLLYQKRNQGCYVPLGTLYAFEKHFSGSNIEDMKFWTKNDRDKYFNEIKKVYEEYTKNI